MEINRVSSTVAREFLNHYHPLRAGGCLKGQREMLAGYENGIPVFLAVFVYPRSRWTDKNVQLELSRLAWSPLAKRSAVTFLRKCFRLLRCDYHRAIIVTYAMPGSSGIIYERSGFYQDGYSSGCSWSRRGPGERATPETIGEKQKLKRFFKVL